MDRQLSRREFLKWLGLTGGALTGNWLLTACAPLPAAPPASLVTATRASPSAPVVPTDTLPAPSPTAPPAADFLPHTVNPGESLPLPAPRSAETWPLMKTLLQRHSNRNFRPDEIPLQEIGDLLWAGFGVNRPDTGGRTAPSAYDVQDIQIYLTTASGGFLYQADAHSLLVLGMDDLRGLTGSQGFVAAAPLNLVYVSDGTRLAGFSAGDREHWPWAHAGCIAQNVSLACAALGLATVVRSTLDRQALATALGLTPGREILLAQTVGYPA